MNEPLAHRLRPQTLDAFVGQQHLVGPGKPLRVAIEKGHGFSFVMWGPPGSGKTTLAHIYARAIGGVFHELSAVAAGKADVRKIVDHEQSTLEQQVLFLDEIHRFNKAQQDFLLPYVESGDLLLIGATTENPSFEVIGALLSRLQVFVFEKLTDNDIKEIVQRSNVVLDDDALAWIVRYADGDAREALRVLDTAMVLYDTVTEETLHNAAQARQMRHDKTGEQHHTLISAFIKSMRASQPSAALYYLARMVEAGEDPKFIARRMVIFASEDIGLKQPTALVVANAVFRAVETIGLPEAAISLAHGVSYLANARKDRSSYDAYKRAVEDVKEHGQLPVPMKLRNAPTDMMKEMGHGVGYEHYTDEDLRPEKLHGHRYFDDNDMTSQ